MSGRKGKKEREHQCGPECIIAVDVERAARAAQPTAKKIVNDVSVSDADHVKAMGAAFETAIVALATGASILFRLNAPMELIARLVSSAVTAGVSIADDELRAEKHETEAKTDERKVH